MVLKSCKIKSCGFDLACFNVQLAHMRGFRIFDGVKNGVYGIFKS